MLSGVDGGANAPEDASIERMYEDGCFMDDEDAEDPDDDDDSDDESSAREAGGGTTRAAPRRRSRPSDTVSTHM